MSHALARTTDPVTSRQAAFEFDPIVLKIEDRIVAHLRTIRGRGGMTSHALATALQLDLVTVSPRLRPLVDKGLVRESGQYSKSASGRQRILWEAV
jgi:predicted transcriptional regulator